MMLFEGEIMTDAHWHICYKITVAIRKNLLSEKTEFFPVSDRQISNRKLTDACKSRIRYVGGYCLKTVRYQYVKQQNSCMYAKTKDGQSKYEESCERVNILNCLREQEEYLKQTSNDPGSLQDVIRKQYVTRGLTHISDELFNFFVSLCETCLKLLIDKNLNKQNEQIYGFCLETIMETKELYGQFVTVVRKHFTIKDMIESKTESNQTSQDSHTAQLYEDIIRKFLFVMLTQFRKDLLQSFSVAKTMAHRKQIQIRKQKAGTSSVQKVTFKSIQTD